jgi:uncharacterized protein
VKSGDVVRVRVLSVDIPRKRISLTLRLDDDAAAGRPGKTEAPGAAGGGQGQDRRSRSQPGRDQGSRDQGSRDQGSRSQGGQGQRGRDQGRDAGGQGQRGGAPDGGAMADALRRAGLVTDQPGPGRGNGPRRPR